MKPTRFPQVNVELYKPKDMSNEQCGPLPAYRGEQSGLPVFVSCFELDNAELLRVIETKKVWLYVYGSQHPPVALDANNPWRKE